ncbi:hypothetical protein B0H67DRAFT_512792 [Lasiosphaeris hirsuta]|uniref:Uncharacterized protein n=1 Tax=Lasiosphaeris hirsuta TaxID=260670 RepID=A0AA40DYH4_9PEZI|nr:hypothetical protein B0H67DRAFT_512792 [Lasiosphaeris hirsuta]
MGSATPCFMPLADHQSSLSSLFPQPTSENHGLVTLFLSPTHQPATCCTKIADAHAYRSASRPSLSAIGCDTAFSPARDANTMFSPQQSAKSIAIRSRLSHRATTWGITLARTTAQSLVPISGMELNDLFHWLISPAAADSSAGRPFYKEVHGSAVSVYPPKPPSQLDSTIYL